MPSSGEKKPATVGDGAIVAVGATVGDALGLDVAVDGAGVADGASLGRAGVETSTSPPSATATTARTAMVMTCQPRNPRAQAAQRLGFTTASVRRATAPGTTRRNSGCARRRS